MARERESPRHLGWYCVIIAVIALALRLVDFGASRPLWIDESMMGHIAEADTWSEAYARARDLDWYPPLYMVMLRGVSLLPKSEVALRLPSLLAMLGAIVLFARLIGRLAGWPAALGFAALAAVLPPWVFYAREARPYAVGLLVLAALLSTWLTFLQTSRGLAAFTVASLAATVAMFQLWPVVAFLVLWALAAGKFPARRQRVALVGVGGLLLAAMAVVKAAFYPVNGPVFHGSFYEIYLPAATAPGQIVAYGLTGTVRLAAYLVIGETQGPRWQLVGTGAGVLLLALSLFGLVQSGRTRGAVFALHCLAWTMIATFAVFGVLWLHPFGGSRHCLPVAALLLLSATLGAAQLAAAGARWLAVGAAAGCFGLGLAAILRVPTPSWYRMDFPGVLEQARRLPRPPAQIAAVNPVIYGLAFYSRPGDAWHEHLLPVQHNLAALEAVIAQSLHAPPDSAALAWQAPDDVFMTPWIEAFQKRGGRIAVLESDGARIALLNPSATSVSSR